MIRWPSAIVGVLALSVLTGLAAGCGPVASENNSETSTRADGLTIATWNLEWFFDHRREDNRSELSKSQSAPSRRAWQWKVDEVARVIAEIQPDILALQEVENRRVLEQLAEQLRDEHRLRYHVAFIEGLDSHTEQDVALLYRGDLLSYSRYEQTAEMFASNRFYNVSKHLIARFRFRDGDTEQMLTVVTAHLRAGPDDAAIRKRQCRLLHTWVRDEIVAGANVVVLGDFNTEVAGGAADASSDLGALLGLETEDEKDDLLDLHERLPPGQQATHLSGRSFDRILVSRPMIDDADGERDWVFESIRVPRQLVVRGSGPDSNHFNNYWGIAEEERDVSDHYPVVARFAVQ